MITNLVYPEEKKTEEEKPAVVIALEQFINLSNSSWMGTATDLIAALSLNIQPNRFTRILNCHTEMLRTDGILYTTRARNIGRIIELEYVGKEECLEFTCGENEEEEDIFIHSETGEQPSAETPTAVISPIETVQTETVTVDSLPSAS